VSRSSNGVVTAGPVRVAALVSQLAPAWVASAGGEAARLRVPEQRGDVQPGREPGHRALGLGDRVGHGGGGQPGLERGVVLGPLGRVGQGAGADHGGDDREHDHHAGHDRHELAPYRPAPVSSCAHARSSLRARRRR
jgi:hypothetical protein